MHVILSLYRQSSSDEPDPSTEATDSQKTTTMSKRPPEPVPRPVESEAWKSSKSYSTGVVHICKISSGMLYGYLVIIVFSNTMYGFLVVLVTNM